MAPRYFLYVRKRSRLLKAWGNFPIRSVSTPPSANRSIRVPPSFSNWKLPPAQFCGLAFPPAPHLPAPTTLFSALSTPFRFEIDYAHAKRLALFLHWSDVPGHRSEERRVGKECRSRW